jgi:hypothetical protein
MIEVELTYWEMLVAAQIGVSRQLESLNRKLRTRNGTDPEDGFKVHIQGAMGEVAAAKGLGVYWPASCNSFKNPDLPPNIQVRLRTKAEYDLILRDGDADDEIFVLITGSPPTFSLKGWCLGKEGKKDKWKKDPNGRGAAYWVPQTSLRPISELPIQK